MQLQKSFPFGIFSNLLLFPTRSAKYALTKIGQYLMKGSNQFAL